MSQTTSALDPIRCPVASAAARSPDHPAVATIAGTLSYRILHRRIAATATELARRGIVPGDRVGFLLEPGPETVILFWALGRVGAVACPLNTRLPPMRLTEILGHLGCRALVTDRGTHPAGVSLMRPRELAGAGGKGGPGANVLALERPASVLFTSGSSGQPKAVLHTAGNHYHSALGANQNLPLGPGDRWLLSLPLYHAGGLAVLWRAALAGAAVAMAPHSMSLQAALGTFVPTHLSLVPTQLWRLVNGAGPLPSPDHLVGILVGGAAAPLGLLTEARRLGLPVITTYGCTEAASQVTATRVNDPPAALATSGEALPHRALCIAGDGEILVRGDILSPGYLQGDALQPLTDDQGWYHTGDLGKMDAAGRLCVAGRRDGLIISGGENIHPETVEAALATLPGVRRCLVVGIPDAEYGQRPAAFVQREDGSAPDTGDIRTRLEDAGLLPRFMLPVRVFPWPADAEPWRGKADRTRFERLARREA